MVDTPLQCTIVPPMCFLRFEEAYKKENSPRRMFDGTDAADDIDLRQQHLPLTIGHHSITHRPTSSSPSPRTTTLSRGRTIAADMKKESTPATQKDIDGLKLSMRQLETRFHELESRVQYVNPWAVQHMWEVLMKLQERSGGIHSAGGDDVGGGGGGGDVNGIFPGGAAMGFSSPPLHGGGGRLRSSGASVGPSERAGNTSAASPRDDVDLYRSCSPLTPHVPLSTTFDVSIKFPSAQPTTTFGSLQNAAYGLALEEWMARQQLALDESTQRSRLLILVLGHRTPVEHSRDAVWATPQQKHRGKGLLQSSPQRASGRLFPIDDEDYDDDEPFSNSTRGRAGRQSAAAPPRLRSKFVEALLTDRGFEDRIRTLLADFVHPIMESSQKRFVSEAERWMQVHTGNIHHEFHEQMKTLSSEKDAATALLHDRLDNASSSIAGVVSHAKAIVNDSVATVNRLRDDVVESSNAVALKLQRLDTFQQEIMREVSSALDTRLSSLRASLERIGEHQDLLHRRLDDVQTRHLAPSTCAASMSDNGDAGDSEQRLRRLADGTLLEQSVSYLDGMLLAPSSSNLNPAEHDDIGGTRDPSPTNRLSDSVLLHDIHDAIHRMWSVVTSRGAGHSRNPQQHLAVGIRDLVLRPVSLFPMQLVSSVVSAFLLRHNMYSLRSECSRMKLPPHVSKGLEVGWQWLESLSVGVLLRRSLSESDGGAWGMHHTEPDDSEESHSCDAHEYELPGKRAVAAKTLPDGHGAHQIHGELRGSSVHAPSFRSASGSRSPSVPHRSARELPFSLEMLAAGDHDDGDIGFPGRRASEAQHHNSAAVQRMQQHGTSFYTSASAASARRPQHAVGGGLETSCGTVVADPFYGQGRTSRSHAGLVSSAARQEGGSSMCSSSRSSSRLPSPTVRKKLAFR